MIDEDFEDFDFNEPFGDVLIKNMYGDEIELTCCGEDESFINLSFTIKRVTLRESKTIAEFGVCADCGKPWAYHDDYDDSSWYSGDKAQGLYDSYFKGLIK